MLRDAHVVVIDRESVLIEVGSTTKLFVFITANSSSITLPSRRLDLRCYWLPLAFRKALILQCRIRMEFSGILIAYPL